MRWRLQLLPCQLWPNIRRDLRDSDISNADTLSDKGSGMRTLQRSSMILSSLPPQMTAQLFACASKCAAKAGEALFVAGDRGDGCYRVEQGLVKITVTSDRGEERRSSDRLFPGSDGASVTTVVPHFAIQVAPTMNMRQEHLYCRRNTPSPTTWKCLMGSMSLQWAPDVAPLGGVP